MVVQCRVSTVSCGRYGLRDLRKDYFVNPRDAGPTENAQVAGPPERRRLSFRASGLSVELEITGTAASRRLAGQLVPRQSAVVDIRHGEGVTSVEADALGRFRADDVPAGPLSLRCRLGAGPGHASVLTGWVSA
jgi:hypothetical protein